MHWIGSPVPTYCRLPLPPVGLHCILPSHPIQFFSDHHWLICMVDAVHKRAGAYTKARVHSLFVSFFVEKRCIHAVDGKTRK